MEKEEDGAGWRREREGKGKGRGGEGWERRTKWHNVNLCVVKFIHVDPIRQLHTLARFDRTSQKLPSLPMYYTHIHAIT